MAKSEVKKVVSLTTEELKKQIKDGEQKPLTVKAEINGCAPGFLVGVVAKIRDDYWAFEWLNGPLAGQQFKYNPANL